MKSFDELSRWLDEMPDQTDGDPCAISNIGELYIPFSATAIARPGDEKLVERQVVGNMVFQLKEYLATKSGRIYWRVRLQTEVQPHAEVLRFDVRGPDKDPFTDMPCVMDKNWVRISAFCKLVRATAKTMEPVAEQKAA
jgi:hypothetical protein